MSTEADDTDEAVAGEGLLGRWSRRKQSARAEENNLPATTSGTTTPEATPLTDADMPSLESLNADSDYSVFFSPRVSEVLRQQALNKLFKLPGFNVRDGLDDYDEDFTQFTSLGDIVTSDMKHQLETEARRVTQDTPPEQPPIQSDARAAETDTPIEIETDATTDVSDRSTDTKEEQV